MYDVTGSPTRVPDALSGFLDKFQLLLNLGPLRGRGGRGGRSATPQGWSGGGFGSRICVPSVGGLIDGWHVVARGQGTDNLGGVRTANRVRVSLRMQKPVKGHISLDRRDTFP